MEIRAAWQEEAAFLAEMDQHCFLDHWKQRDWISVLSMPQYHCYIAVEDGTGKGFLLTSTASDEGEILKIGVLPDFRGQSLGARMLSKAMQEWKKYGVKKLFLEVRESNQFARKLYTRQGFEEVGIRKNYYKNPKEHAIVYMRNL